MLKDLRFALRSLRRNPGFTPVVVLTLALGIGANTAVFSVVARALLDRLPYRAPNQLVVLYGATSNNPGARGMRSTAEIRTLQEHSRTFSAVAALGIYGVSAYAVATRTREIGIRLHAVTTHDLLTFLGAPAVLLAASAAAYLVPARRAAGVDPMEVLRYE